MFQEIYMVRDNTTLAVFFMAPGNIVLPYRFTDAVNAEIFLFVYYNLVIKQGMPIPSAN